MDFIIKRKNNNKINGIDIFNIYNFFSLDKYGKPYNRLVQVWYDSKSENIIDKDKFLLYLNSFKNKKFDFDSLFKLDDNINICLNKYIDIDKSFDKKYYCVDGLIPINGKFVYKYDINQIKTKPYFLEYKTNLNLSSNLLLINNELDYGSVYINYIPNDNELDWESFLRYIVCLRSFKGFCEECCEKIFNDLLLKIKPKALKVTCKFVRKNDIDINSIRIYDDNNLLNFSFDDEINYFTRNVRQ